MPVTHHSVFTGQMPFLPPNKWRQSTEDTHVFSLWKSFQNPACIPVCVTCPTSQWPCQSHQLDTQACHVWTLWSCDWRDGKWRLVCTVQTVFMCTTWQMVVFVCTLSVLSLFHVLSRCALITWQVKVSSWSASATQSCLKVDMSLYLHISCWRWNVVWLSFHASDLTVYIIHVYVKYILTLLYQHITYMPSGRSQRQVLFLVAGHRTCHDLV